MPEKIIPIECSHCHVVFLATRQTARRIQIRQLGFCSLGCRVSSDVRKTPVIERLNARLDKNGPIPVHRPELGPCWVWTGPLDQEGYGNIRVGEIMDKTHRASYRCHKGEIPAGLDLDHLCRTRSCANPDHLDPVTHIENVRRGETGKYQTLKTHCPKGHEYTPENVRMWNGSRSCRECGRIGCRLRARRKALEARIGIIQP